MEDQKQHTCHTHADKDRTEKDSWRRQCGCLKTSDKLKELLKTFPSPPPPSPNYNDDGMKCLRAPPNSNPYDVNCLTVSKCIYPTAFALNDQCISSLCKRHADRYVSRLADVKDEPLEEELGAKKSIYSSRSWHIVSELVQLVQLSVTATALALYYLIFCYMQLVYYTLRSALYFHNADGPMKVTIGVVTITSVVVGFNLLLRMERLIGVF